MHLLQILAQTDYPPKSTKVQSQKSDVTQPIHIVHIPITTLLGAHQRPKTRSYALEKEKKLNVKEKEKKERKW